MLHVKSLCLLACILAISASALATPIFEFKFNETGTTAANTGSAGVAANALSLRADVYGSATDLHSADGLGVGDGAGNRALDMSALPADGGDLPGFTRGPNVWVANANCAAINSLTSATYSGWLDADSPIPTATAYERNPEILKFGTYSNGIEITFARQGLPGDNYIRVHLNGSDAYFDVSPYMGFSDTNKWFYWAFTYDGTQAANNAKFYMGTASGSVALVATASMNLGAITATTSDLSVGCDGGGSIAFDGKIDNVRIDGSVLSQSDLETRRAADVPEPVSLILLGIGGLACLRRR